MASDHQVHVRVVMDPPPDHSPLFHPPPEDFPSQWLTVRFVLKIVYTVHAIRGAVEDFASQIGELREIDRVVRYLTFCRQIFSLREQYVERILSEQMVSVGVPPEIHDEVVEGIIDGAMRMASGSEEVFQAIATVRVFVSNWDSNEASLSSLRWGREGNDIVAERAAAESFEEYEFKGCSTSPSAIDSLEKMKFSREEEENRDQAGCSICMEDVEVGSLMLKMPCKHAFHESCLLEWLSQHHVCPLCRFQLPKKT